MEVSSPDTIGAQSRIERGYCITYVITLGAQSRLEGV